MSVALFNDLVSKLSIAFNIGKPIVNESAMEIVNDGVEVVGGNDAIQAVEDVFKGGDIDGESKSIVHKSEEHSSNDVVGGDIYDDKNEISPSDLPPMNESISDESNKIDDGMVQDPYVGEEDRSNEIDENDIEEILPDSESHSYSISYSDDGSVSGDEMFNNTLQLVTSYRLKRLTEMNGGDITSPKPTIEMHGGSLKVETKPRMLTLINEYPWVIKK